MCGRVLIVSHADLQTDLLGLRLDSLLDLCSSYSLVSRCQGTSIKAVQVKATTMATIQTPPPTHRPGAHKAITSKRLDQGIKKSTRRERAEAESRAAANRPVEFRLPERLMMAGAASLFISIGVGLYGLERDSGFSMVISAASMLVGFLLTAGALARYRFKSRHRHL